MSDLREIKREARRALHDLMAIPMQYYSAPGEQPVEVRARLHYKFTLIGDDRSMGWAEIHSINPRLIFLPAELPEGVTLERGAILYVQPGEAYRIDNTDPTDDISVTVSVARLSKDQYEKAGLPPVESAP